MKTHNEWRVLPLAGKYYGTKVEIGDRAAVNVWLPCGDSLMASVREVAKGWEIEDGFDHVETQESYEAACLISAAPKMYEALKMLDGRAKGELHINNETAWGIVYAAIAKAEGQ